MNLFSQAWQGLNLSPGQRAFLKLVKGWVYTALGAGLIAGSEYLMNNQQIDWRQLATLAGGAVALSILTAADKYFTAQGDAPLVLATKAGEQKIQQIMPQPAPVPAQPVQAPAVSFPQQPLATQANPYAGLQFVDLQRHFGDTSITPTVGPGHTGP